MTPLTPVRRTAAGLCFLLLAACGTTVDDSAISRGLSSGGPVPGAGGDTTTGDATGDATTGDATGGTSGFAGGSTADGTGGTSGGFSPTSGGTTGTTGSVNSAMGPGITPTTVYFGAGYTTDAGATNAAIGAAGTDPGDQRQYYRAVLDDLKKRGGVLGRELKPVYHEFHAASAEPFDAQRQAACSTWTQDNKVFAIFDLGPIAYECARKAGALVTVGGASTGPVYAKYPHLVDPSGMRLERLSANTVNALVAQRWHVPSAQWPTGKIGLITWDNPDYRYAMANGYHRALRSKGLRATDTRYIAVPSSVNSMSEASAAVSSAVIAFRQQAIDHVFILDGPAGIFTGAGLTFLFLRNAQSQTYYPRYGFNSFNSPGNTQLYPAEQQRGMLALEFIDNDPANDQGIPLNPHRERCFRIMRARNLTVSDSSTMNTAAGICESVWFLETLLKRSGTPTLRGVLSAADDLGRAFGSPYTYGTFLGLGRHDGAELVRVARFDDACQCMRYMTKPFAP